MAVHRYVQCRCGHELHEGPCSTCGCVKSSRGNVNPRADRLDEDERNLLQIWKGLDVAALTIHQIAARQVKLFEKREPKAKLRAVGSPSEPKILAAPSQPAARKFRRDPESLVLGQGPKKGEGKLLEALSYFDEERGQFASHAQLGLLTGFTKTTRNTYAGRLIAEGLARRVDGRFAITREGRAAALRQLPLTPLQWLGAWRARLRGGSEQILERLLHGAGGALIYTREQLEEQTGYTKSSVNTFLSPLVTSGIVERWGGGVRVIETIYAEYHADQRRQHAVAQA